MPVVELIYFDAGGGHRSAALALKAALERDPAWRPRLTNLQELLDPIDWAKRLSGSRIQDIYNHMLKHDWTWGATLLLPALHSALRLFHRRQVELLQQHWQETSADLVVSLVPHFNRALLEGLQRALPAVPFVTVLTDFADFPPHFWIERQEQFFICGTARAVRQARSIGIPAASIYCTSGMIVHPRFYETAPPDRAAEREKLGLDPSVPTGLALFGGYGSADMLQIARRLAGACRLQMIFICGRNEGLAAAVQALPVPLRRSVLAYTPDVPLYMAISDFFIGKPGPGSISEALLMELPVIIYRSAKTLPQERYNADWVRENQVGVVVHDFRMISEAVRDLLNPALFTGYRARAVAHRSHAVFEIPEILKEILVRS